MELLERDEDGKIIVNISGDPYHLAVVVMSKLSLSLSLKEMDKALADAKALKAGKIMPSIAEEFRKIPPRGVIERM